MLNRLLPILLAVPLLLAACATETAAPDATLPPTGFDYPNGDLLVSAEWLNENRDAPQVLIIDMRADDAYAEEHIPGAVNVPVSAIASTIDDISLEFDRDEIQETFNSIGLTPEDTVIIYDNLGMMNSGRLFWTLEYVGHEDVRVLNGGWNAWVEAGYETTDAVPEVTATEYPITLDESKIADAEYVLENLDNENVTILDARSPMEYTGEVTFSDRAGHIPNAENLPWTDTLTGGDTVYTTEDGWGDELRDEDVEVFKSAEEIQAMLDELGLSPQQEVITYCQTFWRGAHLYFLMRLMGYEDVRGYDGSWAEWGNNPDLPIEPGTAAR